MARSQATHAQANRGTTLVELMCVLAIIGLLTGLAVTVRPTLMPGLKARTETEHLVAALRQARATAMREARGVTVIFPNHGRSYRIDQAPATRLAPGFKAAAEVPSAMTNPSGAALHFYAHGGATGATITLRPTADAAPTRSHRIAIDWLTGRVQLDRAQ